MILTTICSAKIEKIDNDYYRISSQNVREIYELKLTSEYWRSQAIGERRKNSLTKYYVIASFILGVVVAK
jgi:hypothetical protein